MRFGRSLEKSLLDETAFMTGLLFILRKVLE
jgi:hypothetical protein